MRFGIVGCAARRWLSVLSHRYRWLGLVSLDAEFATAYSRRIDR
jgi:hypothetical protein